VVAVVPPGHVLHARVLDGLQVLARAAHDRRGIAVGEGAATRQW
jgi:hypothetical protein